MTDVYADVAVHESRGFGGRTHTRRRTFHASNEPGQTVCGKPTSEFRHEEPLTWPPELHDGDRYCSDCLADA